MVKVHSLQLTYVKVLVLVLRSRLGLVLQYLLHPGIHAVALAHRRHLGREHGEVTVVAPHYADVIELRHPQRRLGGVGGVGEWVGG